jgi:hypothetical protein
LDFLLDFIGLLFLGNSYDYSEKHFQKKSKH